MAALLSRSLPPHRALCPSPAPDDCAIPAQRPQRQPQRLARTGKRRQRASFAELDRRGLSRPFLRQTGACAHSADPCAARGRTHLLEKRHEGEGERERGRERKRGRTSCYFPLSHSSSSSLSLSLSSSLSLCLYPSRRLTHISLSLSLVSPLLRLAVFALSKGSALLSVCDRLRLSLSRPLFLSLFLSILSTASPLYLSISIYLHLL